MTITLPSLTTGEYAALEQQIGVITSYAWLQVNGAPLLLITTRDSTYQFGGVADVRFCLRFHDFRAFRVGGS